MQDFISDVLAFIVAIYIFNHLFKYNKRLRRKNTTRRTKPRKYTKRRNSVSSPRKSTYQQYSSKRTSDTPKEAWRKKYEPNPAKAVKIGAEGEKRSISNLRNLLNNYEVLLNDIQFHVGNHHAQIDHIVITQKGIFVVETKNYSGFIIGKPMERTWTQKLKNKNHVLYSPLKQNDVHIQRLRSKFSNLREIPMHSVIVFTGSAKLSNDLSAIQNVVYINQLESYINNFESERYIPQDAIAHIAISFTKNASVKSIAKKEKMIEIPLN